MTDVSHKRKRTGADRRPAAVTGGVPDKGAHFTPLWGMGTPDLGASLGIVTKTASPYQKPVMEFAASTGEIILCEQQKDLSLKVVKRPEIARAERWALKSVVNELFKVPTGEKQHRTTKCMIMQQPIPGVGLAPIQVHKSTEHGKAFYTGLMTCGSIWNCPVCAAKISERRRQELKQAMDSAVRLGWQAHFVTLTIRHGIGDDLKRTKQLQQQALRRLNSGKNSIKSHLLRNGIEQHGYIRAYEITHGNKNGFHPHFHIILFTSGASSDQLHSLFAPAWQKACVSVGLSEPTLERGCTVKDGTFAAEYVSKWGIEDEMTKANQKKSKLKGITPWGLLRAVLDNDDPEYSPGKAASLFRVYSKCMHGARQLYWSNGLRQKLALAVEMTDEQLAEQITDEPSRQLASISFQQWKAIREAKAEAHILTAAEALPDGSDQILTKIINGYLKRMPKKKTIYALTEKEILFFERSGREGTATSGRVPEQIST